ncbi:MAG: hypothetical protein HQ549_06240 [Candidatus Omnitrophica bacterium]|nr:hypothetical protein [Candidatus Omnitrophota bacterium]
MSDERKSLNELILNAKLDEQHIEAAYFKERAENFTKHNKISYKDTRSLVIDIHLSLERMLNFTIALLFLFGRDRLGLPDKKAPALSSVGLVPFSHKLSIIKSLDLYSKETAQTLFRINKTRNAFAHGDEMDSPRYNYDAISIFTQGAVDRVIEDYEKAMAEWEKLFNAVEPEVKG